MPRTATQERHGARVNRDRFKRFIDIAAALVGLAITGWLIGAAVLAARVDTGSSGLFRQRRIGRGGRLFWVNKIRTMRSNLGGCTSTASNDPRITRLGRVLRRTRIDELPQFWNVLIGEMSLVGPRPEVPKHLPMYRLLAPEVLSVRPGITCPATLLYRDEELLLAVSDDAEQLDREVLLPDKLRLNQNYVESYTIAGDLVCLFHTLTGSGPRIKRHEDLPARRTPDNECRQAAA
ncbi:Putative undecaprenyl-phosphate N-acetylgalactosaminyl 1-phosphate transferase [Planctomycetes bacterium MalM25]|nr:Putative undecaprenyl-phosphate N-acetylgalactosaminyl 1-phosphate transferase [Planctomycetes bacterium MalM25]